MALAPHTQTPLVNHVRAPVLGAGLTLLLFLPGIIGQGGDVHMGGTGLDQQPYLGRWLLLVAAMVAVSVAVYGVRVLTTRGERRHDPDHGRPPATTGLAEEPPGAPSADVIG